VDKRFFTTVLDGAAFRVGFAVEEELKEWSKVRVLKDLDLEKKSCWNGG